MTELREEIASWSFEKDEWAWYVENQNNLNAKAQARWSLAHKYADSILTLIRTKVDEIKNPYQENIESDFSEGFVKAMDTVREVLE